MRADGATRSSWLIWVALLLSVSAGCSTIPSLEERRRLADSLAEQKQWRAVQLETSSIPLIAYVPEANSTDYLTIYLEGDGFSWVTRTQPSSDPTPLDPVALRLALAQPEGRSAYLARPCQYIDAVKHACVSTLWRGERFSPLVISATNQAVDQLKMRFQAERLVLVGYSGGGSVAALVAARRNDVALLITVAGNLDHNAWSKALHLTPLYGSLNPIDVVDRLSPIPQLHFVGGRDTNITPGLVRGFTERFLPAKRPSVVVENTFDHQCCWASEWPDLWRRHITPRLFE